MCKDLKIRLLFSFLLFKRDHRRYWKLAGKFKNKKKTYQAKIINKEKWSVMIKVESHFPMEVWSKLTKLAKRVTGRTEPLTDSEEWRTQIGWQRGQCPLVSQKSGRSWRSRADVDKTLIHLAELQWAVPKVRKYAYVPYVGEEGSHSLK